MKANYPIGCCAVVMSAIMFLSSLAYSEEIAITGKIGTLGLGVDLTKSLTETVNAKVGINYFNYDYEGTESDIEYDFDLKLASAAALIDWHPFRGIFRISGGILYNGNKLDANAEPVDLLIIGDGIYTPTQIGTLTGNIDFKNIVPYLGIGWGNAVGTNQTSGFVFDIGIAFQGTPDVSLSANGTLSSNPIFLSDLAQEEAELKDAIDGFKYYPVISFGLTYKF